MNSQKLLLQDNPTYQKGIAAFAKKNYAYAVALFQQLLVTYPDSGECRHYLWTAARQNQKTASRSLIIIMSNFIKILIYNLKLFYQLLTNNISSAIQTQEQIIMLNPDNTAAFHKLATFFMHQNQTELRKTALAAKSGGDAPNDD